MYRSLLGQIGRQACVFTFGFGVEHDADLLHAVADAGNGLFYYIDNSDSIPESFCDCLGGLLSVAAQVRRLNLYRHNFKKCSIALTASSPGPISISDKDKAAFFMLCMSITEKLGKCLEMKIEPV